MGPAKPGKTRGLTVTGPGLARQDAPGRVFGLFWNRTKPFIRSKPRPLAGYPDPLLTLVSTQNQQCLDLPSLKIKRLYANMIPKLDKQPHFWAEMARTTSLQCLKIRVNGASTILDHTSEKVQGLCGHVNPWSNYRPPFLAKMLKGTSVLCPENECQHTVNGA